MSSYWPFAKLTEHHPVDLRLSALIVGDTPVMLQLKQMVSTIAPSAVPVLITGPTGSGKELVAQALHMLSEREGMFVPVNCGALPDDLIESELFGHEKGAFTGAQAQRIGLLEQANGGTLFLDEIGEMSLRMQVKLLRALETQTIQRVGGNGSIKVDFRLVSATHRDLREDVRAGLFREDLLFRIEVFSLRVPALAERLSDIPLILRGMAKTNGEGTATAPQLDPDAHAALAKHDWVGNVRELRNFHDRAQVLFPNRAMTRQDVQLALSPSLNFAQPSDETLSTAADETLPDLKQMLVQNESVDMRGMIQKVEARIIQTALELSNGCVSTAAKTLRLKRTTMIGRMEKLGLRGE